MAAGDRLGRTQQRLGAGHVQEGLVDGHLLDQRAEPPQDAP